MLYECEFSSKVRVGALEVPCPADLVAHVFGLPDPLTEFPTTLLGRCSSTSTWTGLQRYYYERRRPGYVPLWEARCKLPVEASLVSCGFGFGPDQLLLGETEDTKTMPFRVLSITVLESANSL